MTKRPRLEPNILAFKDKKNIWQTKIEYFLLFYAAWTGRVSWQLKGISKTQHSVAFQLNSEITCTFCTHHSSPSSPKSLTQLEGHHDEIPHLQLCGDSLKEMASSQLRSGSFPMIMKRERVIRYCPGQQRYLFITWKSSACSVWDWKVFHWPMWLSSTKTKSWSWRRLGRWKGFCFRGHRGLLRFQIPSALQ